MESRKFLKMLSLGIAAGCLAGTAFAAAAAIRGTDQPADVSQVSVLNPFTLEATSVGPAANVGSSGAGAIGEIGPPSFTRPPGRPLPPPFRPPPRSPFQPGLQGYSEF
jgi:hypothetical protein